MTCQEDQTDTPEQSKPKSTVRIDEPGSKGNVQSYGGNEGVLCAASGTVTANQGELYGVQVVNRFVNDYGDWNCPAPPSPPNGPPPYPPSYYNNLMAWFYAYGQPAGFTFVGTLTYEWNLNGALSARCEAAPTVDNNTIYAGAILPDGPIDVVVETSEKAYKGECVSDCGVKQVAASSVSGGTAVPGDKSGQWLIYRNIPVDAVGRGVRLMETSSSPLRATVLEVVASGVRWEYTRPLPVSVFRPAGLTFSAAERGWSAPTLPPGCIYLSQHVAPMKPSVILAEGECPESQTCRVSDRFSFLADRDIFALVNFPLASINPSNRNGAFDLYVRVIA